MSLLDKKFRQNTGDRGFFYNIFIINITLTVENLRSSL